MSRREEIDLMETAVSVLGLFAIAALFGGMVFFPAVVAPTVFRSLPEAEAGTFLRRLFPLYYAYMIATSLVAAIAFVSRPLIFWVLLIVAVSTLAVRQGLVPRLNAWRDASLEGDDAAGRAFETGHRASVVINLVQLVLVCVLLALLALEIPNT